MEHDDVEALRRRGVAPWRVSAARVIESGRVQRVIISVIVVNAILLGLETDPSVMDSVGALVTTLDRICLAIFVVELVVKLVAYGPSFWRSGWRIFDLLVVAVALAPGAGPWAVLRALRVLRVLRLLTVVPALRRVVAAFLNAIPGLSGVMALMGVFFYTAAVLATELYGEDFQEWFGSVGASLYTLFQIMTLDAWSSGMARTIMEVHPTAWVFFVPFIVISSFTILNLFIGIIVSTMQELTLAEAAEKAKKERDAEQGGAAAEPDDARTSPHDDADLRVLATVTRLEAELVALRAQLAERHVTRLAEPPRVPDPA